NWMIENSDVTSSNVVKLTHSLMFGFLSFSPVSKVNFCVCDVENRGNSIIPFLELKKKVPDMFFGKAFTTQDEIHERLYQLSNYIDDVIQNKLGNKYENIFEYNEGNPNNLAPITVLVLYDFPKGFDERNIAELKNVIRNGNKCGIFSIICHNGKVEQSGFRDMTEEFNSLAAMCTTIRYDQGVFLLSGLELRLKSIPSSQEINSFADKYMLIMEGRKNKGLIFPPAVKKLFAAKEGEKLQGVVDRLVKLQKRYSVEYGNASDIENSFPQSIMLGSVEYPVEIFTPQIVSACTAQGLVKNSGGGRVLELPFTCELDDRFNVFIDTSEETEAEVTEMTHSMLMSFFSALPYGRINVSVFDCEKRGNSILPYLEFKKQIPDLFDNQIYTSADAIQEKLGKLNAYIDEFIQEKLGNNYANIVEYNLNSTSRQEPVQLLLIYDFPKGFDNKAYESLLNILKNGSKCGVYAVICYNSEITLSRYDSHTEYIEQIRKLCTCFGYADSSYLLLPYNLKLTINKMLSPSQTNEFVGLYADRIKKQKNKGLDFKDILASELFSCSAAKSLSIPMGVGSGDTIVNLKMGEGSSHHGLIAGATGSGKSTLLHTIIMSAMLNYSPEQLNLYLMDFKSGTEFKIYESVKLPHIKLLALDAMQEFGESILEDLVAEMGRRGELFKSVGQTSLKGYSEATGKSLPRILVIMDEFQILFNDSSNRKIALNCAELTKRIVTEGRAFGIHLLMATQSTKVIRDLTLQQGTIEQMRIRIGLKCGEDDARYLFTDRNDTKALELMKGPIGTAVLNEEYIESSDVGFRAAYCDKDTQTKYLEEIATKYAYLGAEPQIFEGNRTTLMTDYIAENNLQEYSGNVTHIHLGEKIKVAPPFVIEVDRRRMHNMLI
ncbi:MAG: cell division protein FtsK, partial [Clostridia bacterium]|nr:cell division protein FtsK [Clostridia bacterium]